MKNRGMLFLETSSSRRRPESAPKSRRPGMPSGDGHRLRPAFRGVLWVHALVALGLIGCGRTPLFVAERSDGSVPTDGQVIGTDPDGNRRNPDAGPIDADVGPIDPDGGFRDAGAPIDAGPPLRPVAPGDFRCAVITEEGGLIEIGDLRVTFPAGAVAMAVEICLEAVEASGPFEAWTPALRFFPPVPIQRPIEVSIPVSSTQPPSVFQRRQSSPFYVARDPEVLPRNVIATLPTLEPVYVGTVCDGCRTARSNLDVVVVVDDSGSMQEEQQALERAIPLLLASLLNGDPDRDGRQDTPALETMNFAVTTTTLSLNPVVPRCPHMALDARFDSSGCTGPEVLRFTYGDSAATFSRDAQCRASRGIEGCGFEQPFEVFRKALSAAGEGPPYTTERARGDRENAGFLRDEASLLLVLLSDENDCSTPDDDLYNPSSTRFRGELNLRCFSYEDELHPVALYRDTFIGLKGHPGEVVFATITGMPTFLEEASAAAVLAHPDMEEFPDPTNPSVLSPVCLSDNGRAFPGRRPIELVSALEAAGGHGVFGSICQSDYSPVMRRIAVTAGQSLAGR